MSTIIARLYTPGGMPVKRIIPIKLEAARRLKERGALVMEVDPTIYSPALFLRRSWIVAEYTNDLGITRTIGKTLWFVEKISFRGGITSPTTLQITCTDANSLLSHRIVAQYPEEPETEKEAPAQDIILEVLREQLGSSAGTGRDLSTYLDIPANTGIGPTLYFNIAWQEVAQVIENVITSSIQAGTDLMMDIQLLQVEPLQLKVYIGEMIGVNRLASRRVSTSNGLLSSWEYVEDYSTEKTYFYAGGEGDDDDRLIVEVSNQTAITQSVFNRVEGWVENSDADVTEMLESWANAQLQAQTTKPKITGDLVIGGELQWDENIGLGDWVLLDMGWAQYNAVVVSYAFKYSAATGTQITAQVESL